MPVSDETLAIIADEVFGAMVTPGDVSPFSNRFPGYGLGISGPIWSYLYETTTLNLPPPDGTFALGDWPNVPIETEVAFGLCKAPEMEMKDDDRLVTTGTLTEALPAWSGQLWRASAKGIDFTDMELRLA